MLPSIGPDKALKVAYNRLLISLSIKVEQCFSFSTTRNLREDKLLELLALPAVKDLGNEAEKLSGVILEA